MLKNLSNETFLKCLSFLIVIALAFLASILIKEMVFMHNYSELKYDFFSKTNNENSFFPNLVIILLLSFIVFILLDIFKSYSSFKDIKMNNKTNIILYVVCVPIFLFGQISFFDKDEYRISVMTDRYNKIIEYDPDYVNSDNAKILRESIESKNYTAYINVLKNEDNNIQKDKVSINKLLEIVTELFPEKKELVRQILSDNYFTITEYNEIRKSILEDLENKKLTASQIAMIGEI